MFRVDSRSEIHIPPFPGDEDQKVQQFHIVEQCFNVPLWHIQVLPKAIGEDDFQRWNCYLAARASDALGILRGQCWERTKLHVVLPQYLTRTASIAMARCSALWECRVNGQSNSVALMFDTNLGSFVDPEFELLETASVQRTAVRWMDSEIVGMDLRAPGDGDGRDAFFEPLEAQAGVVKKP